MPIIRDSETSFVAVAPNDQEVSSMMRFTQMALLPLAMLTAASGCATHAETGAGLGGLLGAATGAVIGSQTGNAGAGALIGGGLGAVTGGLIGAGQDEVDRKNAIRTAAANAPPAVSPADIVHMSQSGVADDTIMAQIRSSGSVYNLTPTDVVSLKQAGVSERVLQCMLDSRYRRVRPVYYERPVIVDSGPPIIVVDHHPCPPPPVSVGFGYTYSRIR
jgi:uncharacterized membrane protein